MASDDRGYIKCWRKVRAHDFWKDKPFTRGQAWLDMIMRANHCDNKSIYENQVIEIPKGSFIRSERKLAQDWGWSRSKVTRFLRVCEECSMIARKSNPKANHITILNYNKYHEKRTTNEPEVNHGRTTDEPSKEVKNKEEGKKKDKDMRFFGEFWKIYPVKKEKKAAMKEWSNANITPLLFPTIISELKKQIAFKDHCDKIDEFCPEFPYPERWIKKKKWTDETPEIKEPGKHKYLLED